MILDVLSLRCGILACLLVAASVSVSSARDCNGNGVEDIEDIRAGTSADCNGNGVPDECEGWPIRLAAGGEVALERAPADMVAGDLDNDGDLDLVVGQAGGASSLAVLLNKGERVFESATTKAVAGSLYGIAVGDLNGDGFLDAVSANDTALITVLNQGDGSLGQAVSYGVQALTRFVHVADVNGDGAVDVLTTDRLQDTISLWRNTNDGSGRLQSPPERLAITAGGGGATAADPVSLVTADVNADGIADIVATNAGTRSFCVLLGTGAGGFAPPAVYLHGAVAANSRSFSAGDLDGDGVPDLAIASAEAITWVLNRGDGTFGAAVTVSTREVANSTRLLALADLNHDGTADVITWSTSPKALLVKANNGSGGFAVTESIGLGLSAVALLAADFDGDGWDDLALASTSPRAAALVWNGGGGSDGGGQSAFEFEAEVLELEGCLEPRGCRPHGGTLADMDGDGDLDGVGVVTHPGELHLVDNIDGVLVTREQPYTFGRAGANNGEHSQWVVAGDVDGDGDTDLATVDNHSNDFWIHINRGDGTLEPAGRERRIRVGNSPQHVSLGDIDDDGDLDGIVSNMGAGSITLIKNRGDGSFDTDTVTIRTGNSPRSTAVGDFDGDGATDIVVANSGARALTILRNQGNGTFPETGESIRLAGNPNGVAAADVDGDGDTDIVAAVGDRQNCALLLNPGNGAFADIAYLAVDEAGVYSVSVADINLDGVLDLVTANESAGSVSILPGNGDGTFSAPVSYSAGRGAGLRVAIPGDIDGDGDLDIVTFNRENFTATVLHNRSRLDAAGFAESVCTVGDFVALASSASGAGGKPEPYVKFTLPANDKGSLKTPVYQNSSRYPLHQDFLSAVFPEQFPALDAATYDALVGRRDTRHYFVGAIRLIRTGGRPVYGFSVFARFGDSAEKPGVEEVKDIHDQLLASFRLGPLVYAPTSLEAVEVAREWQQGDPGFTILIEGATGGFEPYTLGVGYGRVRILSAEEFAAANASGGISFQDILILEEAPRDIEGVVNGIITAGRQGELSHVAVRTARRGTPNAFLRTALEEFAALEGKLIRLQVTEAGHTAVEVTEEQAGEFWAANAGFLSELPSLDESFRGFPTLGFIGAMDQASARGVPVEAMFGGKASNLARLQTILTGRWSRYRESGFAVPVAHYLDFIRSNQMPSAVHPGRQVTYEEYIAELFADERFGTDSQFRFGALEALREHMRDHSQVNAFLVEQLRERIAFVLGTSPETRVRFRSSSNTEDAIEFNGAGLYDSTQGCVADDLDGDSTGPSLCDETKSGERDLPRALRRVWSSLWNFRAHEERAFYGIPGDLPAMGVLVSRAFIDEAANGVAFTGNPTNRHDPRFVITVQKGDQSVVSPEPGSIPEKNVLEMGGDGQVASIIRAVSSSLVAPGEFVLSDDELRELGALLWHVNNAFPVDTGIHDREDIILDLEFKKDSSGALAIKQVRPFLLAERGPAPPAFSLEIPPGSVLCATFNAPNLSRSVIDEFELKAQLHMIGGTFELPTAIDRFPGSLVEKFVLGPERRTATPAAPGTFTFEKLPGDEEGLLIYRFDYEQQLVFPEGDTVEVKLALLDFHTRDGVVVDRTVTLDEAYLVDQLSLQTRFEHRGEMVSNFHGSCGLPSLQLWEIGAELADGTAVVLLERYRDEAFGDFQPAALVGATVEIAGQRREVADYRHLVYKATRHNEHVEHMVVFDVPVDVPGVARPVRALWLAAPDEHDGSAAQAAYLDAELQEITRIGVTTYRREASDRGPSPAPPVLAAGIRDLEVGGVTGRYLTVSFARDSLEAGHYSVESSADLVTWKTEAVPVSVEDHGDGTTTETWRAARPAGDENGSPLFLRLKRR